MRRWMKSCSLLAGIGCCVVSGANASDAVVQDFDGWKITIQPGKLFSTEIPPGPKAPIGLPVIIPVSFQQEVPPAPEGAVQPSISPANSVSPAPVPAKSVPTPKPMFDVESDGLPIITPGESSQCCDDKVTVSPPEGTVDPRYLTQLYVDIYKSIPFNRAEYNANPSYIHDTAVEFTFGKMRPMTINRTTVNVNHNSPYSYGGYGSPYGYGGYGNGYGFGGYPFGLAYPPLQLVVPGTGLRIHRSY